MLKVGLLGLKSKHRAAKILMGFCPSPARPNVQNVYDSLFGPIAPKSRVFRKVSCLKIRFDSVFRVFTYVDLFKKLLIKKIGVALQTKITHNHRMYVTYCKFQ